MTVLPLRFWSLVVAGAATLGVAAFACSSSSSSSNGAAQCNTNPFACPAGQTCWAKSCVCPSGQACSADNCVAQFACLPSAAGKNPHDTCNNTIGAPTCGDTQACIELTAAGGNCLVYCDPASPKCDGTDVCVAYKVGAATNAPSVNVCVPLKDTDAGNPFGVGDSGTVVIDDGSTAEAGFEAGVNM